MNNREVNTTVASAAPVLSPATTTVPPAIAPIYPPSTSTDWARKPRPKTTIHRESRNESIKPVIYYPESDDMPMAENTEQYKKLTTIKGNIEYLFKPNPNVFIAGDLFWYPVKGRNDIVYAPDVFVAFGRPKGKRGSYRQWEEGNISPQVVFEIWSPGNSKAAKDKKFIFYERYGVEEYYTYDPDNGKVEGWLRVDGRLKEIPEMIGWRSPRLNIEFTIEDTPSGPEMQLYHPDGTRFVSHEEDLEMRRQEAAARVEAEAKSKEEAGARAEAEAKAQESAVARVEAEAKAQESAVAQVEAEAKSKEEAAARVEAEAKVQEAAVAQAEAELKIEEEAAARVEAEAKAQEAAVARAEAEMKTREAEAEAERMQTLLLAAMEQLEKAGLPLSDSDGS